MSRIDEALMRAAEDRGDVIPREEFGATFRSYPAERSSSSSSRRVDRLVAKAEAEPALVVPPAVVPRPRDMSAGDPETAHRLVSSATALPMHVEQHRRLAAVLHEAQTERGLKSVVVTSAVPREGKTLTAVNLALTLSGSYGRRVLLVDGDLRRPAVHLVLGLQNAAGLSDVLRSRRRDLPLVAVTPLLSVLTAGRADHNPIEALSSDRMRALVDECVSAFEWVVIDTPPAAVLSDAQVVARLSGGVLFVIAAGSTPHAVVERAIADLGRECVVGTVLNRLEGGLIPAPDYYADYGGDGPRT